MIIVGAGPAGSTLARLMGTLPGWRILLLDARALDKPYAGRGRIKCCGGLLAPDARRMLARLGLALPGNVLASPQMFAARVRDADPGAPERRYRRDYVNIRREAFDRWLFDAARNVEKICDAAARHVRREGDAWAVEAADGRVWRGRCVVGADGAGSLVRRALFPRPRGQGYVALQERRPSGPPDGDAEFLLAFDAAATDYYAWGLPKDDAYVFGAALPEGLAGPITRARFAALKARFCPRLAHEASGPNKGLEAARLYRPTVASLLRDRAVLPGGAFLIGEAGGFVSPSSAEGISYALSTAERLHRAVRAALDARLRPGDPDFFPFAARAYARLLWPVRLKLLLKCAKRAPLYAPALRRLALRLGWGALTD